MTHIEPTSAQSAALGNTSRFYHLVKSLFQFDEIEVFSLISTLLAKTDDDNCFVVTYLRARATLKRLSK
jgi:hypothetical protein